METQPLIYMTGAVNGTVICMLMCVQQQICHRPARICSLLYEDGKITNVYKRLSVKMFKKQ